MTRLYTRGGDEGETSLAGGQRVRKDDAGVGQKPAPVARMVAALTQGELQVEVERAERVAGSIGGDEPEIRAGRALLIRHGAGFEMPVRAPRKYFLRCKNCP